GEWEQSHSQKFAWTRVFRPMVQGFPLTPFTRLAFVGDVTSSLTHWGTGGLRYINADYTVTASRLPDGEYIVLARLTRNHHVLSCFHPTQPGGDGGDPALGALCALVAVQVQSERTATG